MYKGVLGLVSCIFIVLVMSTMAYDSRLSSIIYDSYWDSGFFMHMNVHNLGTRDIDGGKIILYIPDLDLWWSSGTFEIQSGERNGKFIFPGEVLDIPPGDYLARVMFSSDYSRDAKHIWVTIS